MLCAAHRETHVGGQPQESVSLHLGTTRHPILGFWKFTKYSGSVLTRRVRAVGRGNSIPLKQRTSWRVRFRKSGADQSTARGKGSSSELPRA